MEAADPLMLLQTGSDLQQLESGLDFLQKAAEKHGSCHRIQLLGSIFLPTKRCAGFKLRWIAGPALVAPSALTFVAEDPNRASAAELGDCCTADCWHR